MLIHFYFNISKLLYSFISRRDLKFIIFETIGSIITLLIAFFFYDSLLYFINKTLNYYFSDILKPQGIIFILNGGIYTILFIGSALLSRLFSPQNPIEASETPKNKKVIPVGIIDFTWLSIMSIVYSGILFATSFPVFQETIKSNMKLEYYSLYYQEVNYLFGKSIDLIIILGTILAACMSILWAGQIWRKRDPKSRNDYYGTTLSSIKMVIAFFIIIFATIFWISIPLYDILTSIKNFL